MEKSLFTEKQLSGLISDPEILAGAYEIIHREIRRLEEFTDALIIVISDGLDEVYEWGFEEFGHPSESWGFYRNGERLGTAKLNSKLHNAKHKRKQLLLLVTETFFLFETRFGYNISAIDSPGTDISVDNSEQILRKFINGD